LRSWHRLYAVYPLIFSRCVGIVRPRPALSLLMPTPAENEDMAVLQRMLGELKAENRKTFQTPEVPWRARRAGAAYRAHSGAGSFGTCRDLRRKPAPTVELGRRHFSSARLQILSENRSEEVRLNARVRELEFRLGGAGENATRQIIRDTLSKTGPKINSFLALSGVVEGVASRRRRFQTAPTKENPGSWARRKLDFDYQAERLG